MRAEIQKLLQEIKELKEKAANDLVALRDQMNKEKMAELERQEEKHNKAMSDESSKHQAKID